MVLEPDIAPGCDPDGGPFGDLDLFLGRPKSLHGYQVLVGVDRVLIALHFEDWLVGGLHLEVAVPGGGFGINHADPSQSVDT